MMLVKKEHISGVHLLHVKCTEVSITAASDKVVSNIAYKSSSLHKFREHVACRTAMWLTVNVN